MPLFSIHLNATMPNSWRVYFVAFLFHFLLLLLWSSMWKSSKQWTRLFICSLLSLRTLCGTHEIEPNTKNVIGRMVVVVAVLWSPVVSGQSICFSNHAHFLCVASPNLNILNSIKITLAYDCDGMKQIVANVSNHIYGESEKNKYNQDFQCNARNGADANG